MTTKQKGYAVSFVTTVILVLGTSKKAAVSYVGLLNTLTKRKLLLSLVLASTFSLSLPAAQKAKVVVKEGKVPKRSIELVYQCILDSLSVGEKVENVPKVEVFFLIPPLGLQEEHPKQALGRKYFYSVSLKTGSPNNYTVTFGMVIVAKSRWQLLVDNSEFNLLGYGFIRILDEANDLRLSEKEGRRILNDARSEYLCLTTGPCDWKNWRPPAIQRLNND